MGRSPCCEKVGLKKGPWTPEEDQKLLAYIDKNGHGSWRALPAKAGLQRCGKSCRLRWTNYLRPDIKRGKFSLQEEQTIIQLHALLGNRWSAIATHLPKRTDNEIKNYWNTHLKKRLAKMGIDPVTHKPKNDPLLSPAAAAAAAAEGGASAAHSSKAAATLSHMAQWETARLEAEARLARQSKLRSPNPNLRTPPPPPQVSPPPPRCLDVLNAWRGAVAGSGCGGEIESPTSTASFSENEAAAAAAEAQSDMAGIGGGGSTAAIIDFVGNSAAAEGDSIVKVEGPEVEWKVAISYHSSEINDVAVSLEGPWTPESLKGPHDGHVLEENFVEGFTSLLLSNPAAAEGQSSPEIASGGSAGGDYYEDNKNYWNSILNLVNSSPSQAPIF